MSYKLTERADRDVFDIYLFGAERFGPAQADKYHAGLVEAFELLAGRPGIARERNEFDRPIRVHLHGAHAIVFVIEEDHVLIVRVLHGSQDWRRHI
jgi:toxin ParE1/3/4